MIEDYERHWQEPVGLKDRAIGFATGLLAYGLNRLRRFRRAASLSRGGRRNG